MDIQRLKDYIVDNNLIPSILESVQCHHIKDRGDYYSAANPDGDNITAIQVYKDSLYVNNFTRDIHQSKSNSCDIFTLVQFFKQCNFFEAVQVICNTIGISYYSTFDECLPESIKLTKFLIEMVASEEEMETDSPIKPISENILTYYSSYVTDFFARDGISYDVQEEFELGYDPLTNRITIPIRDELGTLVGVKGRLFQDIVDKQDSKYMFIEPCPRSRILYGLYKAMPYIRSSGLCYVTEGEKGVMQAVSHGVRNTVACCGKKVSRHQLDMLSRLCCDIVLCFDKDVNLEELNQLANKFIGSIKVYALIDNDGILDEHESPTDNPQKFLHLLQNCKTRLR